MDDRALAIDLDSPRHDPDPDRARRDRSPLPDRSGRGDVRGAAESRLRGRVRSLSGRLPPDAAERATAIADRLLPAGHQLARRSSAPGASVVTRGREPSMVTSARADIARGRSASRVYAPPMVRLAAIAPIISGPIVCPVRSTIPLRERSAPRLSDDTEPASSEKTLGRFRPWATPKMREGTSSRYREGTRGMRTRATA